MSLTVQEVWAQAARMDRTLRGHVKRTQDLRRRRVTAMPYTRERMFARMAKSEISVFSDCPVPVSLSIKAGEDKEALADVIARGFPRYSMARTQIGPSHAVRQLPVREVIRRWKGARAIVGVTDLHTRGTPIDEIVDTSELSAFNILCHGSDRMLDEEMMTLVIASPGNVTDSHSDDPDGSNHCFAGTKLWLAWDTFEGMAHGLQDVERQDVFAQAKFDIDTFLKVPSSRWFTVSDGETLFLPGRFSHKVVTLEYYLGIGSFHVALPGFMDSLARWTFYGPLWSRDDSQNVCAGLVEEITTTVIRTMRRLANARPGTRRRWGLGYLPTSVRSWMRRTDAEVKETVLSDTNVCRFLAEVRTLEKENGQTIG